MSPKTPTLADVIRTPVKNSLAEVHILLPGKIESYNAATQKADVLPMIQRFQEDENGDAIEETLPVIPNVPVAFPRGGGFKLTFPMAVGDLVTLNFCESSIDNYQAGDARQPVSPELFQRFDLTDAIATPGWYPDGQKLTDADADDLVIGKDGGAAIHVAPDQINLYEKNAAQFVALAQKVLDELTTARNDRTANKGVFDVHTHITTATVSVGLPGIIAPPVSGFPTQTTPSSVAAAKVKAT